MTDLVHQREDFKSENERLKMKVDSQLKEIEKMRYDLKNQRKTFFTAQNNTQSQLAGNIGATLMSKLNLPAGRQSGYTPGMYAGSRVQQPAGGEDAATGEKGAHMSFASRYGSKTSEVGSSIESKGGSFLSQSVLGTGAAKGGFKNNNKLNLTVESEADASQPNRLSTPSSSKHYDDAELPNMGDAE